jgi:hypothetical protein
MAGSKAAGPFRAPLMTPFLYEFGEVAPGVDPAVLA